MSRWHRYYARREPKLVFQIAGFKRQFVAYTDSVMRDVAVLCKEKGLPETFRELCTRAMAEGLYGDIVALPLDSPKWERIHKWWRPESDDPVDQYAREVARCEAFFAARRKQKKES